VAAVAQPAPVSGIVGVHAGCFQFPPVAGPVVCVGGSLIAGGAVAVLGCALALGVAG